MIEEKYTHKAAQLWCLPKHERKVMDTDFAYSIAQEFENFYRQGRKDAIDEVLALIKEAYKELPECYNGFEWLEKKIK